MGRQWETAGTGARTGNHPLRQPTGTGARAAVAIGADRERRGCAPGRRRSRGGDALTTALVLSVGPFFAPLPPPDDDKRKRNYPTPRRLPRTFSRSREHPARRRGKGTLRRPVRCGTRAHARDGPSHGWPVYRGRAEPRASDGLQTWWPSRLRLACWRGEMSAARSNVNVHGGPATRNLNRERAWGDLGGTRI